jgi:hypothetical protein
MAIFELPPVAEVKPQLFESPLDPALSEQRIEFTKIYYDAYELAQAGYPDPLVNAVVGELNNFEGVQFLTTPDFRGGDKFRCAEWLFGGILNEPWALEGFISDAYPEFWDENLPFLAKHGYRPVSEPARGDIIAYGDMLFGQTRHPIQHFGIYGGVHDGRSTVISKLCQGPVAQHPLDLIAAHWGDQYFYLRKGSQLRHHNPGLILVN